MYVEIITRHIAFNNGNNQNIAAISCTVYLLYIF